MINENQLLEQKGLREKNLDRIEVLEKVKGLLLLPNTEFATTEMVANYFEVGIECINSCIKDNREELEFNGCKVFKGSEIVNSHVMSFKDFTKNRANYKFILDDNNELSVGGRGITLFTKRAILNTAMLLRNGKVAKEIRSKLLDIAHDAEEGKGNIATIVEEIDEETKLYQELGLAIGTGDMDKVIEVQTKITALKNKRITELEEENKNLRIFVSDSEIFTKTQLANKLDTSPQTLAKILKELNVYTKTSLLSESFKSKYPNIKLIQETVNIYKDKCGNERYKSDWQYTKEGAYEVINYLLEKGRVIETENGQFKIVK